MKLALWDIGQYLFPRTVFVDTVSIKAQIEKAESELFELHQLLGRKNVNLDRVAEELEDTILALEGARRILQEKHHVFVNKARQRVINKIKKRGYFTL